MTAGVVSTKARLRHGASGCRRRMSKYNRDRGFGIVGDDGEGEGGCGNCRRLAMLFTGQQSGFASTASGVATPPISGDARYAENLSCANSAGERLVVLRRGSSSKLRLRRSLASLFLLEAIWSDHSQHVTVSLMMLTKEAFVNAEQNVLVCRQIRVYPSWWEVSVLVVDIIGRPPKSWLVATGRTLLKR
jgi:hypothetical protein